MLVTVFRPYVGSLVTGGDIGDQMIKLCHLATLPVMLPSHGFRQQSPSLPASQLSTPHTREPSHSSAESQSPSPSRQSPGSSAVQQAPSSTSSQPRLQQSAVPDGQLPVPQMMVDPRQSVSPEQIPSPAVGIRMRVLLKLVVIPTDVN